MPEQKSCTLYVEGMHCESCVSFLEETLPGYAGVTQARVNLQTGTATLEGDFTEDIAVLATQLNPLIADQGYRFSLKPTHTPPKYREFIVALPAAFAFIAAFLLLQQLGVVNLFSTEKMTYTTAVLIGLIASVSTCLAVVGGLVLSVSAQAAKQNAGTRALTMFHLGRLGGFFIGKVFHFGIIGGGVLGVIVSGVMLLLGMNLLDVFPQTKGWLPKLPKAMTQSARATNISQHALTPILLGVATFFLPCGFTQSMQIYTLTTGSFITGGMTMFLFALGTLPVLAALSFGTLKISHQPWKGTFFKASGLVIIALAMFNLWHTLALLNIISL
jgi:uncharacterized protein